MRFVAAFACALMLTCLGAMPSHAEKRVALVIGNGAYKNAPALPNPKNDAEDVSAALRGAGFDVITGLDLDKNGMDDAAIRFARAARDADVAMFYYSGHAMQFASFNYLMPVDANLTDEADLRRMTRVDEIVADLQQAKNLRILVLDACRDNPLADQLKRSIGLTRAASMQRGLARVDAPQGMIVAYATQAGRTAADGSSRNSPYTTAFLRHIETPDEIGTVFRRVSADVYAATNRTQLPELSLSFIGEFYLRGRPQTATDPVLQAQASTPPVQSEVRTPPVQSQVSSTQVAVVVPPHPPPAANPCATSTPMTVSLSSRSAAPLSTAEECGLKPKDVFAECDKCPEMVVVPRGSFIMGSPASEVGRQRPEGPMHQVSIDKPFAVGRVNITVDQYAAFVADTGYETGTMCSVLEDGTIGMKSGRSWRNPNFSQTGAHPVVCVSWMDANAYALWLSRKTGKNYRLLTEAEWEYAARAGTASRYFFGDDGKLFCKYGNGVDPTTKRAIVNIAAGMKVLSPLSCNDGNAFTAPVGSFLPNGFGLYDMHGNAYQWLQDCINNTYEGAPFDGSAWLSGDCSRRITRGGAWSATLDELRVAARSGDRLEIRQSHYGFRVGRALIQ